jgi:PAS domain S-box-containing protein
MPNSSGRDQGKSHKRTASISARINDRRPGFGYKAMYASSPHLNFILDRQGKFQDANPALLMYLGMGLKDLCAHEIKDFLSEKNWVEFDGALRAVFEDRHQVIDLEITDNAASDVPQFFAVDIAPIVSKESVISAMVMAREITDKKQQERSLRETAEKYRTLVEDIQEVVYLIDDQGNINYISPAISKFNVQAEDLIGRSVFQFIAAEDQEKAHLSFQKALCGEEDVIEFHLALSNGEKYPVQVSSRIVYNQGKLVGVRGVLADIPPARQFAKNVERRAAQLTLLNEIGKNISSDLDIQPILSKAVELLQESFGYYHIAIFLPDAERKQAVMTARAGAYASRFPPRHTIRFGQGMVGHVCITRATLLANDVSVDAAYVNFFPYLIPTLSELSVPILSGDELLGVLDVQSPLQGAFGNDDIRVIETVASQLAVALKNAHLYQEVFQRLQEQERIETLLRMQRDLFVALNATGDFQTAIDILIDALRPLQVVDCGSLYLVDEKGGIQAVAHHGLTTLFIAAVSYHAADANKTKFVMQGKPAYFRYADLNYDPRIPNRARDAENLLGLAELPISHQGKVIANLSFGSHLTDTIPLEARNVLESVASHLGSTIARMKAEIALSRSETLNRALLRSIPDMMFILDHDGRVQETNHPIQERLSPPENTMIGKRIEEILPARASVLTRAALNNALMTGETQTIVLDWILSNSQDARFEARFSIVTPEYVMAFMRRI